MNNRHSKLITENLTNAVLSAWQDTRVRILLWVLFLIGMGALAAVAKKLHPPLGIPGYSAVLWLTVMVAGKTFVRQGGSGLLMGTTVALCTVPVGLHHTNLYNFGLYVATGLALDIVARLPKVSIRNPFGAMFCSMIAHMVKFGFILGTALTSSVSKHFMLFGVVKSGLLHLGFGIAAGFLGWGTYWLWQRKSK